MIVSGARYHVIARSNRGEFILRAPETKELFLQIVGEAHHRYRFTVDTLCIMANHVHLLIRPHGDASLSRVMQWVLSVFAIRFNRRFGLVGHVWYDRFKSSVVGTIRSFAETYRYIRDNPVAAGIVKQANAYRYSGRNVRRCDPYGALGPPSRIVRLLFPEDIGQSVIGSR